jgi:hypothetical protein
VTGDQLCLGITHFPRLAGLDEHMADTLRWSLEDPAVPEPSRDPANWPEEMRMEWGDDRGVASATRHREALVANLRRVRARLDEFGPDVIVVFGDDQYENFREDAVPAFCVQAFDDLTMRPWKPKPVDGDRPAGTRSGRPNVWGEGPDHEVVVRGAPAVGRGVASALIDAGFDTAYAYRPGHIAGLGHAFINSVLFLDYDRTGFDYPVLTISVNCYGSRLIGNRGAMTRMSGEGGAAPLDPPSPSPDRCMDYGAAVGTALRELGVRAAIVASSSWSHAFLVDKHARLYPDVERDRELAGALARGAWDDWRKVSRADLEESGQQEMLNWFCMAGAAEALGLRCEWSELVESWIYNSSKCFAVFS